MSTLGNRGGWKQNAWSSEWEDDNKSQRTTHSSTTIQRSNVSIFAIMDAALNAVDRVFREIGAQGLSRILEDGEDGEDLVLTCNALKLGVDIRALENAEIIRRGRHYVEQQKPQQKPPVHDVHVGGGGSQASSFTQDDHSVDQNAPAAAANNAASQNVAAPAADQDVAAAAGGNGGEASSLGTISSSSPAGKLVQVMGDNYSFEAASVCTLNHPIPVDGFGTKAPTVSPHRLAVGQPGAAAVPLAAAMPNNIDNANVGTATAPAPPPAARSKK